MGRIQCILTDISAGIYMLFNRLTPLKSGEVQEGVLAVKAGTVNFYLLRWSGGYVCMDSGYSPSVIRRELKKLGVDAKEITHVFLTHSDFDHAGGLALLPKAEVYISAGEKPLLEHKLSRRFGFIYNRRLKIDNCTYLSNNDIIILKGLSIRAIATAGHTIGSMSYIVNERYLFSGDAFRIIRGRAEPNRRIITMDMEQSFRTMERITDLDGIDAVFTAHRGVSFDFGYMMGTYNKDQSQYRSAYYRR